MSVEVMLAMQRLEGTVAPVEVTARKLPAAVVQLAAEMNRLRAVALAVPVNLWRAHAMRGSTLVTVLHRAELGRTDGFGDCASGDDTGAIVCEVGELKTREVKTYPSCAAVKMWQQVQHRVLPTLLENRSQSIASPRADLLTQMTT